MRFSLGLVRGSIAALAVLGSSFSLAIDVKAKVNGTVSVIGDLAASNGFKNNDPSTLGLVETGSFWLKDPFKGLMNDTEKCEFRWFQIVTKDSEPPKWMGNPPAVPYTDPPKNGWDYQRNPPGDFESGVAGDDDLPFYENDAEYAKDSETAAARGLGHNSTLGVTRTYDGPGMPDVKDGELQFNTFVVFMDKKLRADKKFYVLHGYSWGGKFTGDPVGANFTFNGPDWIAPAAFDTPTWRTALDNSGFTDWNPVTDYNITCAVPEPGSMAALGLGALALVRRRRRG